MVKKGVEMSDFKQDTEEFVMMCCDEYMKESVIEYDCADEDDPRAMVKLSDDYGRHWEVPICKSYGGIGIDIGDAGTLWADNGGLYCYLWHEACKRIAALEAENAALREKVERLEKALEYCAHVCEQGRIWGGMGWTWNNRIAKLVYDEVQALKEGE